MRRLLPAAALLLSATTLLAKPQHPATLNDSRPPIDRALLNKLPDELRERARAAQEKAMAEPGIREAREKLNREAQDLRARVREATFEIDPGLREAIKTEVPKARFGDEIKQRPKGIAGLDRKDRQELLVAREAVKDEPDVIRARENLERATTPQERAEADEAYRAAMKAALENR
ncbi:MAG: hypothetical protein WA771_02310 [Chthoniobacterales bacterium]